MLRPIASPEDICHKQTGSYLAILYKNNTRKWICRINLYSAQKTLILPDENKKENRYPIGSVADLQNYAAEIIASAKRYTEPPKPKTTEYLRTKWGIYEMPEPYTIHLQKGPRKDLKKIETFEY